MQRTVTEVPVLSDTTSSDGWTYSPVGNIGPIVEDKFKIRLKEGLGDFSRITNFSQPLVGIKSYDPIDVSTSFDGWLGFGPYSEHPEIKDLNFMVSLKNQGIISHNVASFTMPRKANGVIQLGSYNPRVNTSDFTVFKSGSTKSWTLETTSVILNDIDVTMSESRTLIVDPELSYIYVPPSDLESLGKALSESVSDLDCSSGRCVISSSCSKVGSGADFSASFTIEEDETSQTYSFSNVAGNKLIDVSGGCALPFAANE